MSTHKFVYFSLPWHTLETYRINQTDAGTKAALDMSLEKAALLQQKLQPCIYLTEWSLSKKLEIHFETRVWKDPIYWMLLSEGPVCIYILEIY